MNNQKPTQPFNVNSTQAGVATHIVYNNGTLNFSRYLDPAMTPPDGIHNDTIIDNTEGIQANLSFRNLNDNTANDNLTSAVNTASLNLVPNNQMTTNSENLSNDKNTQNGFRTANGHEITPNIRKPPYQVPVNNSSKVVTPRQNDRTQEPGAPNDSTIQLATSATRNTQVVKNFLAP